MQTTLQSTMIRASAGSGKTWQLSNRFLALMVLGVKPEKIIALTFTRKAAGEFTGRIMTRLAEAAESDEAAGGLAAELAEVIRGKEGVPALVDGPMEMPDMDRAVFQVKLRELVESLDRLALSTLDSYFVGIVRNFALELGLSGFDLLEDAAIASERLGVMTTIFSNRHTRKAERESFLGAFKQATWGEEENRLGRTLENFIKEHQNRWLIAPDAEKWGGVEYIWPNGCPLPKGGDYAQKAKRVLSLLGEIENAHGGYLNTWKTACAWAGQHTPGAPMSKAPTRIVDGIEHLESFKSGRYETVAYKRDHVIKGELADAIYSLCGGIVRDEIEVRMRRTRGLFSVIEAYEQRYNQHVRAQGRLCFSDLTLVLAGEGAMRIWEEDVREMVDFRLDARYDHWLLDEFQDTSQPQWMAIRNLVDEIMQDTEGVRSLFVVGDSKQSIYGWRGGEPRLFDDLQDYYGDRLKEWSMDVSYRSSQEVLGLVNIVCDLSDDKWQEIFPAAAVQRWEFKKHVPAGVKRGHALVLESNAELDADADDRTDARYHAMRKLIEHSRPLEKGMTCAILVTKNDEVTSVVDYLRTHLPEVPVAAESETTIADGPVGAVMLDFFRWLQCPEHQFGSIHVRLSPLSGVVEQITSSSNPREQWQRLTDEIARYGVAALVQKLIDLLRDEVSDMSDHGQSRLNQIFLASQKFSSIGGTLGEWVDMLESQKFKENTRAGVIQVMTVHKSKGLGFDVVILPELNGSKSFIDASRLSLMEQKGKLGEIEYILDKPNKSVHPAVPEVSGMMHAWEVEQCYERFCNFYVMLTRAAHATYCIVDPVGERWQCKARYADWLREATVAFGKSSVDIADESYSALFCDGDWVEEQAEEVIQGSSETDQATLKAPVPRVERRVASSAKKYQPGGLLGRSKGLRFGSAVHALFEKITWLDELPALSDEPSARVVAECLETASIRPFFERPESEFLLLREQPIETRIDGQWISGVVDRAVVYLESGKVTGIDVIDYKTDAGETSEALREKYTPQLELYRQALASVYEVTEGKINCYLLSTALGEMVQI